MALKTEPFVLNMGPVHPSTHGVFRMRTTLDGEVVVDIEPIFGYLHRGVEKLAEQRTYTGIIPLTDRLDYISSMNNNLAYCLAVEKLAGIKVPERAEYLRVIMAELQRIAAFLIAVGAFLNDCGAFFTPFMYMFREREKIVDLLEMVSGQRLTYNYIRVGGVSQDIPEEFLPALRTFVAQMPGFIDEYDRLLMQNEILLARAKGVGILTREQAINCAASGPVLRASGVKWDIRQADPYSIYDRFEFDIPTGTVGDCYDRYRVRVAEMRQSLRIIQQAMTQLPPGPVKAAVPHLIRPPVGEAYAHLEAPKGELGFYLVSDNSIAPYRCHIRPPSLINLTALRDMVRGWKVADLIVIFGSIDITVGEIDR
ncbi:MAG: NADH-quinone oxidoreductase subunit D [Dehalococcoidales bacterium]|jgi:NADH-quinone oxidoreductase subunit D|nr:NADH-quinone oxidoreductase subunit NuoD [Dehalococcoidales bacterium]MDP6576479.1 NADH-quinone oxidoreductase subunit D [Dehalococcoidales bacterium]MDP7285695.1 NADH-quinone oxidoreductase subunit D [Dehalococcoidales bacterium]MDP7415779.1 NADH-quinone oxidoreductase subunit D [Dehalococcoidales bacterium]